MPLDFCRIRGFQSGWEICTLPWESDDRDHQIKLLLVLFFFFWLKVPLILVKSSQLNPNFVVDMLHGWPYKRAPCAANLS